MPKYQPTLGPTNGRIVFPEPWYRAVNGNSSFRRTGGGDVFSFELTGASGSLPPCTVYIDRILTVYNSPRVRSMLRPPSDTMVIRAVAAPVLIALIIVASFDMVSVAGPSMEPTIRSGDRVLVFRGAYLLGWRAPGRGDIVLFENPIDGSAAVKRCVGLPGDRLVVTSRNIYLNGSRFPLEAALADGLREFRRIPPDRYFMIGDNAESSVDSRHYGPVARNYLLGKVVR